MHADLRDRADLHAPESHWRADRETSYRPLKNNRNRYGSREEVDPTKHQHGDDCEGKSAQHETAHSDRSNRHERPFRQQVVRGS